MTGGHAHVLVAYATAEGQTEKVTRRVAAELDAAGHDAEFVKLGDAAGGADTPAVDASDGVVVGTSVHAGGFQRVRYGHDPDGRCPADLYDDVLRGGDDERR